MNPKQLPFPIPALSIDNFLPEDEAFAIFGELVGLKDQMKPATIYRGITDQGVEESFRNNLTMPLDQHQAKHLLGRAVLSGECRTLWHSGYTIFDVINYANRHEVSASRYGDGGLFQRHQDTRWDSTPARIVSMVYYVGHEPAAFSGGQLVIWKDMTSIAIEPRHNRAVVFPSFAEHEVRPVHLPDDPWRFGRFSVNYWFGFG